MAGKNQKDDDYIVDINVTPFVDVVLVLLVIFMVTAKMMNNPSIPLQLPKASTGETTQTSSLAIAIQSDANQQITYYFNGVTIPKDLLIQKIEIIAKEKKKKKPQAILAVGKNVVFYKVIEILDLLRKNGIEDYAFNIDPSAPDNTKP